MIRHVLLDFDRTLNDSDFVYEKNLDGFLGLTGRQVLQHWEAIHRDVINSQPRERHEDLDLHYNLMIEKWRLQDPDSVKQELKRRIKAAQEECWYATALFQESFPFLHSLKDAGYTLHIATGDYAQQKAEAIQRQAGRVFFDRAFDESVLGVGKGKRDYFDRLLAQLGAPASDALVVGDSLANDIGPARQVGIATIWVRRKTEKLNDTIVPDVTVGSLIEALEHLRQQWGAGGGFNV